jgi:hypothetical protein
MTTQLSNPTGIEQPLRFHELAFLEEGGEVVIGRRDVDTYAVFPPDGAALVRRLADGTPPQDAAAWYERTHGEAVDMDGLLATLQELELLAPADQPATPVPAVPGQRAGRLLFSVPALVIGAAIVALAVVAAVRHPALAPRRSNVFFTHWLLAVDLAIVFGQLPVALFHEAAHVLAGRRLGVRSRIRVSRRLYFVVFETVLDGLVTVPRRRRYLPLAAGMLADMLSTALLTLAAWLMLGPHGSEPLAGRFCLALAFMGLPRIAWQFCIFLRTDVYYLAVTALGCTDLQGATRHRLGELARALRLPGRSRWETSGDRSLFTPRDREIARWFVFAVMAGYALMLAILAEVMGPIAWQFIVRAAHELTGSHSGAAHSADALVVFCLTLAEIFIAIVIDQRERRARRWVSENQPPAHPIDNHAISAGPKEQP